MAIPPDSAYTILGASPLASVQELRSAFKRRALEVHPDKGGTKEAFHKLLRAYEFLFDLSRKSAAPIRPPKRPSSETCAQASKRQAQDEQKSGSRGDASPGVPKSHGGMPKADPKSTSKAPAFEQPSRAPECRMAQIFKLLQQVSVLKRRDMLSHKFSQAQRLELETWIRSAKRGSAPATQQPVLLQAECVADSLVPFESTSDASLDSETAESEQDSNLEHSPGGGGHKIALALCDLECPDVKTPISGSHPDAVCAETRSEQPSFEQGNHGSGIINVFGRGEWYRAVVSTGNLRFLSRKVDDLSAAVDFLLVLTAMKLRIQERKAFEGFAELVRQVVPSVLAEYELSSQEVGLEYCVPVHIKCFFGPHAHLERNTPFYSDLEQALRAWERINQFKWHRDFTERSLRKDRHLNLWMEALHVDWPIFRIIYLDILEESGQCRQRWTERLESEAQHAQGYRERHVEAWNRHAMRAEEKTSRLYLKSDAPERQTLEEWNCRVMEAEEAQQRRAQREELRLLRWNRRAMKREECYLRKALSTEQRLQRKACSALSLEDKRSRRWQRSLAAVEAQAEKQICRLLLQRNEKRSQRKQKPPKLPKL